ncbi:mucin-binding protein [Limosilactobacillus balticus]|uniref:mucin-binding protein n=1 Tax=Limosilactobacillus balticus TaxID=2759747 RepID=UPI0022AA22D3|nr:YSIRK-type signal peptide-containing protein [Limosilactobacillus balticus]
MIAKNNQVERLIKNMPITQHFALRKLSVGVVSVLLGTSIALGLNGEIAQADTNSKRITPQSAVAQTTLPAVISTNDSQSTNIKTTASTSEKIVPTTPVDDAVYTVTNVKATSEQGNGTDHTGRTDLSFDLDLDIANHEIKSGNYINVSMGIPYQLTANGRQYTLSYGGGASRMMPIDVNYQVTSGESYSTVIGYMRPVSAADRSYAISNTNSQVVNDPQNVTWQASQNNNALGSNGNGGSNDSYQIIFNDELENLKTKYGKTNLSLARLHFNLTWHNITGFDLDEAPLDTRYFHLYSSTATAPTMLVPQNDIQIGNHRFTSAFKIPVKARVTAADNFNQTVIPQSSSEYAVHTWYYNQQTKTWSIGDEAARYPDHEEAVALAIQNESGVKLGRHFTITVTKPADNDQVDYQFISAAEVKNAIEKSLVPRYQNYDLDPVIGAQNTYVTRKMISTTAPAITVKSTDSSDGLTRTYDVIVASDYVGFRKDTGIGLISWRPKDLSGVLPPANINDPNADQMFTKSYYQGVALKNTGLQNYLEQHPWKITVTNDQGQELVNQEAGYYLQPYVYRNDTTSNSGILTGKVNNVENQQVNETIHYVYKDTGKEAAPTYTTKLGFARINDDGQWLAWTPANDTFAVVDVPAIAGYHAVDEGGNPVKAIAAITVKHDSPDIDITVYYVADPQVLTYTVIDNDTQEVLEKQVPLANGLSDEPLPTDTAAKYQQVIQGYQDKGYYLVSADKLPAAFDDNPNVNQNVTIYVAKRNQLHSEERTVTRTISYYDKDTGKQLDIPPVKQAVKFTRQAVISGQDGSLLGYSLDGKQDSHGNYLVEETNGDKAWAPATGEWAALTNPILTEKGYELAEDANGQAYPLVAKDHPTALSGDEEVKVFYPEKVIVTNEELPIKRTINYVYANGPRKGAVAAPSVQQQVTFTRPNKVNQVTGETKVGEWTTKDNQFVAVNSPAIDYYTPNQVTVAVMQAKPDDPDITVTVEYKTAPNAVTYTIIDDTDDKTLVDHQSLTSGFADESLPASATVAYQGAIDHYRQLGYTVVSEDKLPSKFTHIDQNVVVHILMKNSLQVEHQTTMRTITYYDRTTDKQIMIEGVTEPVIQQATFARQAIVVGPHHQIIGYTLNQQRDQNGNYLVEVPLANADQAWKLERGGWPASPNPDLQKYGYAAPEDTKGNPYPVVADGHPTALVPSESVKVYYQPRMTSKEEQVQSLQTIHYVYANGPRKGETAAPDVRQAVTFARLLTTNEVTKEVNRGEWQVLQSETIKGGQSVIESDPTSFAAVISPSIKGYTPDQTVVASALVTQGEQPIEVTVNYTTEPHEITYSVIDDATGLTLINHARLGSGYADGQLPLAMREDYQNVRAHYEQLGYKLVSQETLPATFADHDLNVIVHLTHGTERVTDQRIINEDIRYEFVEGGIAAPSYQAAPIVFTRDGLTDQVTGKTSWESWEPVSDHFTPVVSPLVAGYTPSNQQIDEQYVTVDSQDLHFIVLYSKNPVKPHPTPNEPDEPVTPIMPVTPVNPEKPASSSSAGSTPAQSDEPLRSDTPSSSGSASTQPIETPKSDGPTSSAVPNSEEPVVPELPTTPTRTATGINSTPVKAVSAASELPVSEILASEPVTVHTVSGKHASEAISSTSPQKLPQTGNQHQSVWHTILSAFLGLFGINLSKRRKKNN